MYSMNLDEVRLISEIRNIEAQIKKVEEVRHLNLERLTDQKIKLMQRYHEVYGRLYDNSRSRMLIKLHNLKLDLELKRIAWEAPINQETRAQIANDILEMEKEVIVLERQLEL